YVFVAPFQDDLMENDGCHLYSVDIKSGEKKDLGLVVKGSGASFTSFIDNKGKVWFSLWKRNVKHEDDYGNLYCYDPELDKIETYTDVLPKGQLIDGTEVKDEELNQERSWTWSEAFPGNEKCFFTMGAWGGGD